MIEACPPREFGELGFLLLKILNRKQFSRGYGVSESEYRLNEGKLLFCLFSERVN